MKLKVIVDPQNRIVAVASMMDVDAAGPPALVATPLCPRGHREHEIAVPSAHRGRQAHEHWSALHVDASGAVSYGPSAARRT